MADATLELVIDRSNLATYSAEVANVTGAIQIDWNFPVGEYLLHQVGIYVYNVGTPTVTIQDNPGVIWHRTGGVHPGSVTAGYVSFNYGAQYGASAYWFGFDGKGARLSQGDYLDYRNLDLEAGSTMDVGITLQATQLR